MSVSWLSHALEINAASASSIQIHSVFCVGFDFSCSFHSYNILKCYFNHKRLFPSEQAAQLPVLLFITAVSSSCCVWHPQSAVRCHLPWQNVGKGDVVAGVIDRAWKHLSPCTLSFFFLLYSFVTVSETFSPSCFFISIYKSLIRPMLVNTCT